MPNVREETVFCPKNTQLRGVKRNYKFDACQATSVTKKNSDHEIIQYFSEVVSIIENGFKNDFEKGHFIENVLEQTVGKEVELSCDRVASRCIEKLLEGCRNPYVIIRFMEALSRNLNIVCVDQCASHIAEKLLHTSLLIIKSLSLGAESVEPMDVEEKNNIRTACFFWAYKFGQFFCQHLELGMYDTYGCHVLSAVIQLLGCCHVNEDAFYRKKMQRKGHTHETYVGHENSFVVTEIFPSVPEILLDLLKHITIRIVEHSNLSDLIFDSRSSAVIQILLLVLKKRILKYFVKISQILLSIIFSKRSREGVPLALCDRSSSYLMEKVIELSDEHEQELIWMGINQCLPQLILHPIGNYTIQRLFYSVHKKQQFESMFDATIDHFEKILRNHYFGIWLSIAKSCNRLKTRQVQFLTKVMQLLKCSDPTERNLYFSPLLLGFETYDEHQKKMKTMSQSSSLSINLFGSLILQEILKFSKPFKAVRSILDMKPEKLVSLACHEQGCYVLISFLEGTSIAKKDKEKLIQQLKLVLVPVASDFIGNLTLCRMWSVLSVDQKLIIAEELARKKSLLLQHKCGVIIFKKFAIFHFEHHMDKWKEIQQSLEKKRQILKELVT